MTADRLQRLRNEMRKRGIAMYVVPTADFHESEYVGEYFKARAFLTGFTGSAGTAVVTLKEAGLWTDGRYFLQAEAQLKGSGITLYRSGEEGVPKLEEYISDTLCEGGVLGYDGRVVNAGQGKDFEEIVRKKHGSLYTDEDLVGLIWEDRPPLPAEPVWLLEEKYAGRSVREKLSDIRSVMREKGAGLHLLTSLYDIAWLLNVRGNDIHCVPVVLSYLALTQTECLWFVQEQALDERVRGYLEENAITIRPYEEFYDYVESLGPKESVLLDTAVVNDRIVRLIPRDAELIDEPDPSVLLRAVKNPVEIGNIRDAHIKDAVAMCRFMCWLKKNVGKTPMTETSVTEYLENLRAEQEGFLEISFDTICGYAEHGAIVHYQATRESDVVIRPEGLLLVDSGGHYLEGTTDITRTFALGPVTEEMKADFTRVLRANLNLAAVRFLYGCTGRNLDILARAPFWEADLDYKHGTGHGVGYVLNVHEGPNGFRWQKPQRVSEDHKLEPGMVTTDEPGIYLEGKYGIRLENELLCCEGTKNEYGRFLYFEQLTFVPMDLDAIEPSLLSEREKGLLNEYHRQVFEKISPYLEGGELAFLKEYTKQI